MSDKEALARVKIDKLLEESGWRLLDDNQKRKNVVLEQGYRYDKKTKFTDYLLLDAYSRPLAVIEAKKKDYPLRSAKAQAMEYATRLGVRYFYLSNGEEHLFCDVQDGVLHPSDSFLNQDELIALTENSDIRKKLWEEACEDTLLAEIKVPIAKHLKRDGRAGVIVPEGVVFQSANAYKNLRRMLIEENYLYAVISLPSGVFNPYSGVKTSILLMDRALARKTDKILFVKMNNDGFDLGAQPSYD